LSQKASYRTVAKDGEGILIEKKSKFIATVRPVQTEEEALAFLEEMRKTYSDANHNVYAYVIDENNIFRYSDDGEPQGTAGIPVLDVIRKEHLVDTAVVVTRYFGGTLLGTGGLVRAYGAAAKRGIDAAHIITRTLCSVVSVKVDYTLVGKIQYKISTEDLILDDTIYENEVTFLVCLPEDEAAGFIEETTELTNGRAICKITDRKYVNIGD
jgi:uncharacterized YigZ family protein